MDNTELLKALKELTDANQTKADANLKETTARLEAI
jgi:hypothetical protein